LGKQGLLRAQGGTKYQNNGLRKEAKHVAHILASNAAATTRLASLGRKPRCLRRHHRGSELPLRTLPRDPVVCATRGAFL
jgi:hypothetical protein